MRCVLLLILVGGCNLVFRASAGEPEIDAATARCPGDGSAPRFRGASQKLANRRCAHYTQSQIAGLATARCDDTLVEGALDSGDLPAMRITGAPIGFTLAVARIAADGQTLYVRMDDDSFSTAPDLLVYRREVGEWVNPMTTGVVGNDPTDTFDFSAPSRGPVPVLFVARKTIPGAGSFQEFHQVGSGWTLTNTYLAADFELTQIEQPSLSEDGLRLVFMGPESRVHYVARSNVSAPFPSATTELFTGDADDPTHPYLRDDCGRLYVAEGTTTTFTTP